MKKILINLSFAYLVLVILFLPFQSFLIEVLTFHTNLTESRVFWLAHWYEPIILFLAPLLVIVRFIQKEKMRANQFLILALVILGTVSILFLSPSFGIGFEGFRFTLLALLFYLFAREIGFQRKKTDKIINVYLYLSLLISFWAILERVFPWKYWNSWGILSPEAVFGYGWHTAVEAAQSTSIFSGPNQLASYLLPAFFIILVNCRSRFSVSKQAKACTTKVDHASACQSKLKLALQKEKIFNFAILLMIALAILLSFSRSALVGLVFGFLFYLLFFIKNKLIKLASIISIIIVMVLVYWFFEDSQKFQDLLMHGASQGSHIEALRISLSELRNRISDPLKLLFGSGLGTAGPLALKYGNGLISESWYLQVALELGVIGLMLWLSFIFTVIISLNKTKEFRLALGLISVSIAAIFLHTFADNPALSYTLFILVGLKLSSEPKHEKNIN